MAESPERTGPSVDDQPFMPTGQPIALPDGPKLTAGDQWYYLKINYTDENGNPATGYAAQVGQNAADSFWDYMRIARTGNPEGCSRFRLEGGWQDWPYWRIDDGNWLSVKATGWIYRSSAYPIGWQISHGQLLNTYWVSPMGYQEHYVLVSPALYLGVNLPAVQVELIPAPKPPGW